MKHVFVVLMWSIVAIGCSAARQDGHVTQVRLEKTSENDLYGDGKYMERWDWLVANNVIVNETPYDANPADRLLYINAYTYAVRTKIDAWKMGTSFWWSPLLTESSVIQDGYYHGMDTAGKIEMSYAETVALPIGLTSL